MAPIVFDITLCAPVFPFPRIRLGLCSVCSFTFCPSCGPVSHETYIRLHGYIVQPFGTNRFQNAPTMTSADFSQFVVTAAPLAVCETSRDKPTILSSSTRLIYAHGLRLPFGTSLPSARSSAHTRLIIRFLSVGLQFRYPFLLPAHRCANLGSRCEVRRQLRPSWTSTTD